MTTRLNVLPLFAEEANSGSGPDSTADRPASRVLVVTTRPGSLHGLALEADWASSAQETLDRVAASTYVALFVDIVLPQNQSGHRLVRRLREQHAVTAPIYLMCDHPQATGLAVARHHGATGLICRRADALGAALQRERRDAPVPAREPRFVDAIIRVAQLFLASEAERVVRSKMKALRLDLGRTPSPHELIAEACEVLDDESDRIKFTRLAGQAAL